MRQYGLSVHVSTDLPEHCLVDKGMSQIYPIMVHNGRKFDRSAIFSWVGYLPLTEWDMWPKFRKFDQLAAIMRNIDDME